MKNSRNLIRNFLTLTISLARVMLGGFSSLTALLISFDWLIEHPTERKQIEWIANQVGDACEEILKKFPGKHKRLADHFWCDVLAALAHAIDEVSKKIDSISENISSYIANLVWEILKQERSSSTTSGSPNPRSKKKGSG